MNRIRPSNFDSMTEQGIEVPNEFKHLRGVPAFRAVHDNTIKPERVQQHEAAPRPELPGMVADALELNEEAVDADELRVTANQSILRTEPPKRKPERSTIYSYSTI